MDKPTRIQRKRTKGWRLPENTVIVSRPTIWGNPWTIEKVPPGLPAHLARWACVDEFRAWLEGERRPYLDNRRDEVLRRLPELRGKNLACWCKEGEICHADVLLEMANREERKQ
jgi:hypothetical protein